MDGALEGLYRDAFAHAREVLDLERTYLAVGDARFGSLLRDVNARYASLFSKASVDVLREGPGSADDALLRNQLLRYVLRECVRGGLQEEIDAFEVAKEEHGVMEVLRGFAACRSREERARGLEALGRCSLALWPRVQQRYLRAQSFARECGFSCYEDLVGAAYDVGALRVYARDVREAQGRVSGEASLEWVRCFGEEPRFASDQVPGRVDAFLRAVLPAGHGRFSFEPGVRPLSVPDLGVEGCMGASAFIPGSWAGLDAWIAGMHEAGHVYQCVVPKQDPSVYHGLVFDPVLCEQVPPVFEKGLASKGFLEWVLGRAVAPDEARVHRAACDAAVSRQRLASGASQFLVRRSALGGEGFG
ncbi:MAG: hypothetical protein HC945_03755, partial [Nitrosarchaeum sp.]|nr:hypothetical protein [Nitrosarchaeum sp.]